MACFVAVTLSSAVFSAPTLFRPLSLEAARNSAKQEGKLLIIDFTASWCGPCHRMEATSWADPQVQKWANDNAVVLQFDVDKDKEISQKFEIRAMPTVVIMAPNNAENEFDRHVGYLDNKDLLQWFSLAREGKNFLDLLKLNVDAVSGKGGEAEVKARWTLAKTLLERGKPDDALTQYLWLWEKMPTELPDGKELRDSWVFGEIATLTAKSDAARERFAQMRDAAIAAKNYNDFVVLNDSLTQSYKTLDWFDKVISQKEKDAEPIDWKPFAARIEQQLISKKRWADVLRLYPDPTAQLNELHKTYMKRTDEYGRSELFPRRAAILYAALLSARRESDAKKYAAACLRLKDTDSMKRWLVLMAMQANQARKDQLKLIEFDQPITDKLQEMLKAAQTKSK